MPIHSANTTIAPLTDPQQEPGLPLVEYFAVLAFGVLNTMCCAMPTTILANLAEFTAGNQWPIDHEPKEEED
jgi:hypothetical protein